MTRTLILYHASCADGFCAAWAARRAYGGGADYLPVQYGEGPPPQAFEGGRKVFVLDFSYPRETLTRLADRNELVAVLDHHKTAAADLQGLTYPRLGVTFDMNKSGGRLAWEFFQPTEAPSWLVDYTEDRDLWRWKLPRSREVSAAIASHPFDFALWDRWHEGFDERSSLAAEGEAILRYQQRLIESAVENAAEEFVAGHKVLAVNATVLQSEIAGKLAEGRPFGACYFVDAEGRRVWSLRSRDGGIDVSEVAKAHGGGGHRNAAGFRE